MLYNFIEKLYDSHIGYAGVSNTITDAELINMNFRDFTLFKKSVNDIRLLNNGITICRA